MSQKRILTIVIFVVFIFQFGISRFAHADDADVLPKGISKVSIGTNFYFPIDQRYNPDGDAEDVAVDYNTTLNSSVFPALGLVEAGFGLPAGSASMGKSVVSFEYDFTITTLTFQHGITDKLSAGIVIPYWSVKNNVDASLNTSSATVGKNAAINSLAPLAVPGTVPLTTDDIQNLLGSGLDINGDGTIDVSGYGIERVETWSGNGLSDIEAGFRYQYMKTEEWRLAFTGGIRFPTGKIDDTDSLVDYGLGSGAYSALLRSNNDYTGIKNLTLNGTFRYDLVIPDEVTKRVPSDVNLPITSNKEKVDRDIGDLIEIEASGKYNILKGVNMGLIYKYGSKMKDKISGSKGYAYESLEKETDSTDQILIADLSYSTVPLYLEKKISVPFIVSFSYRNRFAGTNNTLKSEYIGLTLQTFF